MMIEAGGYPIHIEEYGSGPETVMILQGWGTNASLYRDLAQHLSAYLHVWLPELPGFGESPEPKAALDAEDYADVVLALCRVLNIRECHLIGHSNGGRIMLALCSRKRDIRFGKLVFMDAAGLVPPMTAKKRLRQTAFKLLKVLLKPFPGLLEKYRQSHGSADYRSASPVMRQTLVKLVNTDLRDRMPQIPNSSLLIWGTEDRDTPLWMGETFEKLLPDAGLVKVPGAGHYAYLEQSGFVYRVLDSYFGADHHA